MVILKNTKKIILTSVVALIIGTPIFVDVMMIKNAKGISLACQNSPACREAVAREQEANRNAIAANNTASLFQAKVNELSSQIASMERVILDTQAQVNELNKQIKQTQAKLKSEQEALAELLINMHFEGDAEPIQILASSNSISDLAEKQARNEVVKQQISATATNIRLAKEKLEADKAEVETLLAQQKSAKTELESKRSEQQNLVTKYQNDAAAYAAVAKEAMEAQRKAEQEEKEAHPELYSGSAYSGANTYPWQGDCPARQDQYMTVGGYVCECVSYVGWKVYEFYGLSLSWGNASDWDYWAGVYNYRVDRQPEAGAIGQDDGGLYGHVFWVESVNADGSINVTEYNNAYATGIYSGSFHIGDFGARTISAAEVPLHKYIHIR